MTPQTTFDWPQVPRRRNPLAMMIPKALTSHDAHAANDSRQGYRASSADLHAGLEVSAVRMTSLPLDTVSEFLRLRKVWLASGMTRFPRTHWNW